MGNKDKTSCSTYTQAMMLMMNDQKFGSRILLSKDLKNARFNFCEYTASSNFYSSLVCFRLSCRYYHCLWSYAGRLNAFNHIRFCASLVHMQSVPLVVLQIQKDNYLDNRKMMYILNSFSMSIDKLSMLLSIN